MFMPRFIKIRHSVHSIIGPVRRSNCVACMNVWQFVSTAPYTVMVWNLISTENFVVSQPLITLNSECLLPFGPQSNVFLLAVSDIKIQMHRTVITSDICRSRWPRGPRRRSTAAHLLRSWVRIPPRGMDFCLLCVVR